MQMKTIQNQNGITLLEVLISMIILSLAILVLLNMAMVALDSNDWANRTTVATQLMQEKLEQLRSLQNPTSGADTISGVERSWTVTPVASHLRQVDVVVGWEDLKNVHKTNSLTSYIRTDSV